MKKIFLHILIPILGGVIIFTSCKKEKDNYAIATLPPSPSQANATINFHIRNSSVFPGYDVYLYRIISYPAFNIYDSTQNIYLRPNIDTTFIYTVGGNTSYVFIVGGDPFDDFPLYAKQKFIVAGSNVNWDIEY